MNDDVIADLKQFIAATISQQLSGLYEGMAELRKDVGELREGLQRVDQKIDALSASVADALEASNQANETQLKDHERRITHLEQQTA